jgi:hypothetical protein
MTAIARNASHIIGSNSNGEWQTALHTDAEYARGTGLAFAPLARNRAASR